MDGTSATETNAVYGTYKTASAATSPGGRYRGMMVYDPSAGNLWLFAGWAFQDGTSGRTNSLWLWNSVSLTWAYVLHIIVLPTLWLNLLACQWHVIDGWVGQVYRTQPRIHMAPVVLQHLVTGHLHVNTSRCRSVLMVPPFGALVDKHH